MKKICFTDKVRENNVSVWLFAACSLLLGIIIGFCFAPIKKGMRIASNNHIVNKESLGYDDDYDDDDYDDYDDEESIKF